MIRISAVLFLLLGSGAALAQTDDAPLVFEAGDPVPLAGASAPNAAMAGNTYLLPFAIINRTAKAANMRRIAFRLHPSIEVIDPNIDGIDNDRDGLVDEGDEGFTRVDDSAAVWRIDELAPQIAQGAKVERAVKVRLKTTAEAGETLTLGLIAAASADDSTMRATQSTKFTIAPPTLSITLGGTDAPGTWMATDTPSLRATAQIPSGRISNLSLAIKGSPAVDDFDDLNVTLGEGIECDGVPGPKVEQRKLIADFGSCQVISTSPMAERFVALEAKARFSDADPFADPDVITARRAVRLAAAMTRDDELIHDPAIVSGTLTGPLVGARLLSVSETPVDAGDSVKATYRLVNRGDAAPDNMRLFLKDDSAVECKSFNFGEGQQNRNACTDGLALSRMNPATLRDVTIAGRLRNDATFGDETALNLALTAKNMAPATLPPARLRMRMPADPTLSIDRDGEWNTKGNIITARIGDSGSVQISGTLPEGRTQASLRLLTRLVDAQTGAPIGPAPIRVEAFTITPSDEVKIENRTASPTSATENGWTAAILPLGIISVPVTPDTDATPSYSASATLSLRDLPEMQAGRLIEMAAQLSVFGETEIRSEDWAELLIVEPALDLTVRSPDEDRIIDLHDTASVALLTCNQGSAAAEAIVMTARLPDGLLLHNADRAKVRIVPLERAGDNVTLFGGDAKSAGEVFYNADTGILRGAMDDTDILAPENCLELVFQVRRSDIFAPENATATLTASVEPFTGRDGAQARIYPSVDTGNIRFTLPPVLFGPVSKRDVEGDGLVSHTLSLEVPVAAGPHRVDLTTESSAGLEWTVLKLDKRRAPKPWRNGEVIPAGEVVRFRFETPSPEIMPLGWVDTTLVRALAFSDDGVPVSATTRLITRRSGAPGGQIKITKKMALDRDCDGELGDERIQDALFEPVKDASAGDCVIFRVVFKHMGSKSMERIVVRDRVPSGTELRSNAVEILRTPEPLQDSNVNTPSPGSNDIVWSFEGLFEPGVEGEVSYAVKLMERP